MNVDLDMAVLTYNEEAFVNVSVLFYHATNPGVRLDRWSVCVYECAEGLRGWMGAPSRTHARTYTRTLGPISCVTCHPPPPWCSRHEIHVRCLCRTGTCARWNSPRRPPTYVGGGRGSMLLDIINPQHLLWVVLFLVLLLSTHHPLHPLFLAPH